MIGATIYLPDDDIAEIQFPAMPSVGQRMEFDKTHGVEDFPTGHIYVIDSIQWFVTHGEPTYLSVYVVELIPFGELRCPESELP